MSNSRIALLCYTFLASTNVFAQSASLPTPLFYQDGANTIVTFNNLAAQVTYFLQVRNDRNGLRFANDFLKKLGDTGSKWAYSSTHQNIQMVAIDPGNYAFIAKGKLSGELSNRYLAVSDDSDPLVSSVKDLFVNVDELYRLTPTIDTEHSKVLAIVGSAVGAGMALVGLSLVSRFLYTGIEACSHPLLKAFRNLSAFGVDGEKAKLILNAVSI